MLVSMYFQRYFYPTFTTKVPPKLSIFSVSIFEVFSSSQSDFHQKVEQFLANLRIEADLPPSALTGVAAAAAKTELRRDSGCDDPENCDSEFRSDPARSRETVV